MFQLFASTAERELSCFSDVHHCVVAWLKASVGVPFVQKKRPIQQKLPRDRKNWTRIQHGIEAWRVPTICAIAVKFHSMGNLHGYGIATLVTGVILFSICFLLTFLRFWSKRIRHKPFSLADYLVAASLFLVACLFALKTFSELFFHHQTPQAIDGG